MKKRFSAALVLALTGCAGAFGSHSGNSIVPTTNAAIPFAKATPPVTAPVIIPYPYTNKFTVATWAGPKAKPVKSAGTETGTTTVKFLLDKKTGVYDVLETIDSNAGYTEVLNSAITFPQFEGGTAQIILSDNYTYVQGALVQTGLDTYPQTQDSVNFPLTPGRTWSAAAHHLSSFSVIVKGKSGFAQTSATDEAANGSYTAQAQFSSTHRSQNQDNYASTTDVKLFGPSVYQFSAPAAGFNPMEQKFALPSGGTIAVTTSGKSPIPGKAGTKNVADWYPRNGKLPTPLYTDDFRVAGNATIPSDCGKRAGQSSTKVVERSYNVDPVQGFDDSYTATYYMRSLAKGQYWFACIVEAYTNTSYANGWFMSKGSWGGPYSQTTGVEILLASGAKSETPSVASIPAMHVLEFVPPAIAHLRLERLGGLRR